MFLSRIRFLQRFQKVLESRDGPGRSLYKSCSKFKHRNAGSNVFSTKVRFLGKNDSNVP